LLDVLGSASVLLIRGADGLSLPVPYGAPVPIPTESHKVFAVTGAGDTVGATLALAAGADLTTAARLAGRAAGIIVGRVGTAIRLSDLRQEQECHPPEHRHLGNGTSQADGRT
jgi:D-beta-D-heptose 7-phosphate kinase/D-beta-D-heptose 1-phosphate adenosyltransferase